MKTFIEIRMPEELIPIFHVKDGQKSALWYARLGFEIESEHRFAPGMPLYLFLRRGNVRLHLSEHKGDARPGTLVYFYVDDLDAVAREFNAEILQQPWGREIKINDPDENRFRIGERFRKLDSRHFVATFSVNSVAAHCNSFYALYLTTTRISRGMNNKKIRFLLSIVLVASLWELDALAIGAQGSIYGWVVSQNQNENTLSKPEAISIYVAETEVLASIEEDGTFYFPDLDSGRYTLIAEGKGFMKAMTTNIDVVEDSLTFARIFINDTTEVVYKPSGDFKIGEVSLQDRGHIEGYISLRLRRNEDDGLVDVIMPLEGAIVSLARTAYTAETDSLGYFRIKGVIAGMYDLV